MYFALDIGLMCRSKSGNEPMIQFVANDFSDYKMDHSGRFERLFGSGVPKYYLAFVLEPYGELVRSLNTRYRTDDEKLSELKSFAAQTLQEYDFHLTKNIVGYVSKDVGFEIDYRDVSYWAWLTPSLQFF